MALVTTIRFVMIVALVVTDSGCLGESPLISEDLAASADHFEPSISDARSEDGRSPDLSDAGNMADSDLGMDMAVNCRNHRKDGLETDVDCGGFCPACDESLLCGWARDCRMAVCRGGVCDSSRISTVRVPTEGATSIAVGDVTGDGLRDVMLGNSGTRYQVLERVPGAGFRSGPLVQYGGGGGGNYIYLADTDRDGRLDLLSGAWLDPEVYVVRGTGGGSFAPATAYRITGNPKPALGRSLAAGDFDGDGDLDVAVGQAEEGLVLLRNRGNGNFGVETLKQYGGGVGAGDFDKDGVLDVALESGALVGRLSKRIACDQRTGGDVLVGDFNGDGWPDLGSRLELCLGDGRGGLLPARAVTGALVPAGARLSASWSGDLNGDGRSDLIAHSRVDVPGPPAREVIEVALGAANGNLRYSWSLGFDEGVSARAGVGRAISESRDDLLVAVVDYSKMPVPMAELRIITFK